MDVVTVRKFIAQCIQRVTDVYALVTVGRYWISFFETKCPLGCQRTRIQRRYIYLPCNQKPSANFNPSGSIYEPFRDIYVATRFELCEALALMSHSLFFLTLPHLLFFNSASSSFKTSGEAYARRLVSKTWGKTGKRNIAGRINAGAGASFMWFMVGFLLYIIF